MERLAAIFHINKTHVITKSLLHYFVILSISILISGCVQTTRKPLATFASIDKSLPVIAQGRGRVFIANAPPHMGILNIKIDGIPKLDLSINQFSYFDLSAGAHELYASVSNIFGPLSGTYKMKVEKNQEYFVEAISNQKPFTPMNTRVRFLINADNNESRIRWRYYSYVNVPNVIEGQNN